MDFLQWLIDALTPPPPPPGYRYCKLCQGNGHGQGSTFAHWSLCPACEGKGIIREVH